MDFKEIQKIVP